MAGCLSRFPVVGSESRVVLPTGEFRRVVKLNNAATTPPFRDVVAKSTDFMDVYDALHRGSGVHAEEMVTSVDRAVDSISKSVGASSQHGLLFGANTSDAILKLARLCRFGPQDVVLSSDVEHTSNYLPWKYASGASVCHFESDFFGSFSPDSLEEALDGFSKVKIVAVTGASNLTGFIPDLKKMARLAHDHGAWFFVDAAQLAPHKPLDLARLGVDFAAFSAHKTYAPYGLGVLVGLKDWLEQQVPVDPAGGSPDYIWGDEVVWSKGLLRHQSGTWNANGIICLAEAFSILGRIGWTQIMQRESDLLSYAVETLSDIEGVRLSIPPDASGKFARTAVVSFSVDGFHPSLVSSYLANEWAVSTRSGEICNHRLVARWNHLTAAQIEEVSKRVASGDLLAKPGIVRASFGLFNTLEDVDVLAEALRQLVRRGPRLKYAPVSLPEPSFEVVSRV